MQKQISEFVRRALPLLVLLCLALPNPAGAQNVPASWKRFNATYFSFSYPPTWTITQVNDAYVRIQVPDMSMFTMEIEHTTAYGSNVNGLLNAEAASLQDLARKLGLHVTVKAPTFDFRRSGASITADFDTGAFGQIVLNASASAVVIGNSIYVLRMMQPPTMSSYSNITDYWWPLVDSIAFHFPTFSISGTWTSLQPKAESCNGIISTQRNYTATLALVADGNYSYTVHQSNTPAWDLRVAGNWAVTDPNPYRSENAGQILLKPTSSDLQPPGTGTSEMTLLGCLGYPTTVPESFAVQTISTGDLQLVKSTGSFPVAYKLTASGGTPGPALTITDSAAFSNGPVAQGSLISLFGSFPVQQAAATSLPLPTSLSQLSVTVAGRPAPLLFASPTQVNLQLPFETPVGNAAVAVIVNGTTTVTGTVAVSATAPKLFAYATNHAVSANDDYTINSATNPAKTNSYLIVYITGQGAFRTIVASGTAAPVSPLAFTSANTTATIGGQAATVAFSGGAPGLAGVGQINVQVPAGLATGDYPLVVTVGGVASNTEIVSVKSSLGDTGTGGGSGGASMKVYVIRSGDPDSDNAVAQLISKQGHAVTLGVIAADLDQNAVQLSDYNSVVALGGANYDHGFPAAGRDWLRRYLTSSGGLIADGSFVDIEVRGDTLVAPLLPARSCGELAGRATSLTRVAPADFLPSSLPATASLSLLPVFFGTTTYTEICLSPVPGAINLYDSQEPGEAKARPGIIAGEVGPSRVGALSVPVRKWVVDNTDFGGMFSGLLQWVGAKTQVTKPVPSSVPAGPLRILVLRSGDSDSDNMVLKSLTDKGHMPTLGSLATAFDGSGVDLTKYQVVVALGGAVGFGSMPSGGLVALKNYLHGAGGLIADSQLLQNQLRNDRTLLPLLPGTSCGELSHSTTGFEMVGPSEPILTAGVAASFNVNLTLNYIGTRTYNESCLTKTDGARVLQYSQSAGDDIPHPAVLGNEPDIHSRVVLFSIALQRRELSASSFLNLFVNTVEWAAAHK